MHDSDERGRRMANDGARRPSRPARSHEDIYDLVEEANAKATDAVHRTDLLTQTLQRVEAKLDVLAKIVGSSEEDERGEQVGTGLVGTVMRLTKHVKDRFNVYDKWRFIAWGFLAACGVFGPVLWWLLDSKLEALLK